MEFGRKSSRGAVPKRPWNTPVSVRKSPCGTCGRSCINESVFCATCQKWNHYNCEALTRKQFTHLDEILAGYMCWKCSDGGKDFNASCQRLSLAASMGSEHMKWVAKMENILLRNYAQFTPYWSEPCGITCDEVSKNLLGQCNKDGTPISVKADGNCLFNSLSLLVCGDECHATEIRVRTCIEMVENEEFYRKKWENTLTHFISPDYSDAIIECAKDGAYSSAWTILAAATVVKRDIESIYPTVNGPTDQCIQILNTTFHARLKTCKPPIRLMWTSISQHSATVWKPDHFVPLIRLPATTEPTPTIPTSHKRSYAAVVSPHKPVSHEIKHSTPTTDKDETAMFSPEIDRINTPSTDGSSPPNNAYSAAKKLFDSMLSKAGNTPCGNRFSDLEDEVQVEAEDVVEDEFSTASSDITEKLRPIPGAIPITNKKFLPTDRLTDLLLKSTSSITEMPAGIKSNIYMVINDKDNFQRRENGKPSNFTDDCGVWSSTSASTKRHYYRSNGRVMDYLERKNDLYCKPIKRKMVPLDPQPDPDTIMILRRNYQVLKRDQQYKKRCSWIEQLPANNSMPALQRELSIVEYIGNFPDDKCLHGNAKNTDNEYARTKPAKMDLLKEKLTTNKQAREVYESTRNDSKIAPRDFRQVQNAKFNMARKERGPTYRSNTADDIQDLLNKIDDHPLIQQIVRTKNTPPCVILYTKDQIRDIINSCTDKAKKPSVLGVDRTFNLGACYVTVTVFQHMNLFRKSTDVHPIMLGPTYLHWDGHFNTYHHFFSHLQGQLSNIKGTELGGANLTFGSDEEKALLKAIAIAFPASDRILCVRHLRENMKRHLTDKIGVTGKLKQEIDTKIFGNTGLLTSEDEVDFDRCVLELTIEYQELLPNFMNYFQNFCKTLREDVFLPQKSKKWLVLNWTNNACESMNFILKLVTNWKVMRIPDLIEKIYSIIQLQYADIRRGIHGQGNYEIAPWAKKFKIRNIVWGQMTEEEKVKAFNKFQKGLQKKDHTVTSTDGLLTIPKTPRTAKKPGQRKRVKATRTTTLKFQT